jgi:ABC-type phosphate/phosphonate transport system substrate-binding protein
VSRRADVNIMTRLLIVILLVSPALAANPVLAAKPPETIRIGIVHSLFRDIPESSWGFGMRLFQPLMRAQTGLETDLKPPTDAETLAKEVLDKKLDLGIFQGIEFAWEQQKHPELKPLVILINLHPGRESHLLVRKDARATRWCDLKGKTLALPLHTREHAYVFLEKQCRQCGGKDARHFFNKITRPETIEDALDDVIEGKVPAALVDDVGLEAYRRRKPGRADKLRDFSKSEMFPDTVIAYRDGALDEATLKRCREGLLKGHQTLEGRLLLMFWRVTSFQPVPDDFDRLLADIARAYPQPASSNGHKDQKPPHP